MQIQLVGIPNQLNFSNAKMAVLSHSIQGYQVKTLDTHTASAAKISWS